MSKAMGKARLDAHTRVPGRGEAEAVAIVLAASNPKLVDEFCREGVPFAVAGNVTIWLGMRMPYGIVWVDTRGRGRVVGARDVEALRDALEVVLERVRGSTCCWVIDDEVKHIIEPLVRADASGLEGHA
jgi:hypothetical protein